MQLICYITLSLITPCSNPVGEEMSPLQFLDSSYMQNLAVLTAFDLRPPFKRSLENRIIVSFTVVPWQKCNHSNHRPSLYLKLLFMHNALELEFWMKTSLFNTVIFNLHKKSLFLELINYLSYLHR